MARKWALTLVVLLARTGFPIVADGAGTKAAFAMSIAEFRALSASDQKALLAAVFEYRLEHSKNIHYEAEVRIRSYEDENGKVGKLITDHFGSNYRHWRLGDSYRMETDRGGADVAKPDEHYAFAFDAGAGVAKSTYRSPLRPHRLGGRIDVDRHDALGAENRYNYWLDGKHGPSGEFLIRYLVDHKDSYAIEVPVEGGLVRLAVPWVPLYSEKPLGLREVLLDPGKGFLPVRGKAQWGTKAASSTWRTEEFVVEASQLVGDVWMPIKLKEIIGGPPHNEVSFVNIWETKVTSIEAGTVAPAHVQITFAKGMTVVDAIKGIAYVIGDNGEPMDVQRLVGAPLQAGVPGFVDRRATDKTRRSLLIGTSAGLGLAAVALIILRIVAKRRGSRQGEVQPSPRS